MNDMIYSFKFYFTDGTSKLSGCKSKDPLKLYNDFDGLINWEEFDSLHEKNPTLHEVLELAFKVYKCFFKDFYRIEIVNTLTNEVLDYIDERE